MWELCSAHLKSWSKCLLYLFQWNSQCLISFVKFVVSAPFMVSLNGFRLWRRKAKGMARTMNSPTCLPECLSCECFSYWWDLLCAFLFAAVMNYFPNAHSSAFLFFFVAALRLLNLILVSGFLHVISAAFFFFFLSFCLSVTFFLCCLLFYLFMICFWFCVVVVFFVLQFIRFSYHFLYFYHRIVGYSFWIPFVQ